MVLRKRIITAVTIALVCMLTCLALVAINNREKKQAEQERPDLNKQWFVYADLSDSCAYSENFFYATEYIYQGIENIDASSLYHVKRIDMKTSLTETLPLEFRGYMCALIPDYNGIYIIQLDGIYENSPGKNIYFCSNDTGIADHIITLDIHKIYKDFAVYENKIYLLSDYTIDEFDKLSNSIKTVYTTNEIILNMAFANHCVLSEHTLFISVASGDILAIDCKKDFTERVVAKNYIFEYLGYANVYGHQMYEVFGSTLVYYNTVNKNMVAVDLNSGDTQVFFDGYMYFMYREKNGEFIKAVSKDGSINMRCYVPIRNDKLQLDLRVETDYLTGPQLLLKSSDLDEYQLPSDFIEKIIDLHSTHLTYW